MLVSTTDVEDEVEPKPCERRGRFKLFDDEDDEDEDEDDDFCVEPDFSASWALLRHSPDAIVVIVAAVVVVVAAVVAASVVVERTGWIISMPLSTMDTGGGFSESL